MVGVNLILLMDKREREILAAGTGMVRLGSPDGQHSIFPRAVPDIVQGGELVARHPWLAS